ncbi:MAG: F-box protein [Gammaproteobacteria bacterium]
MLDNASESSNLYLTKSKYKNAEEKEFFRLDFQKPDEITLSSLPNEVLEIIHQFMPYNSLLAMRAVSKSFHALEPRSMGYVKQLNEIPFGNQDVIQRNTKQGITYIDFIKLFSAAQYAEISVIRQWTDLQWNGIRPDLKQLFLSEMAGTEREAPTLESLKQIDRLLEQIHIELIQSKIKQNDNVLRVNNLNLTRFPEQLLFEPELARYWGKLKAIRLDMNQLTIFPKGILQLVNLDSINLSNNQLTSLPAEIGHLVALKNLHLQQNQIRSLPPQIGQLGASLKLLNLCSNQLTVLPDEIRELKKLKWLHLSNNEFTTLPSIVCTLTSLDALSLHRNKLTSLPNELSSSLTKLEDLSLEYNQLSDSCIRVFESQLGKQWVKDNIAAQDQEGSPAPRLERI